MELLLDYSQMASGDTLVVAVGRVAWDGGAWQSDASEPASVARELVRQRP